MQKPRLWPRWSRLNSASCEAPSAGSRPGMAEVRWQWRLPGLTGRGQAGRGQLQAGAKRGETCFLP